MGSLGRHDGYLHNAETIAKVSAKLNIKLHEWNKRSTTDDDDSMSHHSMGEITQTPSTADCVQQASQCSCTPFPAALTPQKFKVATSGCRLQK